jgi:hypothetical protein
MIRVPDDDSRACDETDYGCSGKKRATPITSRVSGEAMKALCDGSGQPSLGARFVLWCVAH